MGKVAVEFLTRRFGARVEAWTPAERAALAALAVAWTLGVAAESGGWDAALAGWSAARLSPPLPSVARLAARLPAGDPRVAWYRASLDARRRLADAGGPPRRLDPNTAGIVEWDRLPGIGPRTAKAIVAWRAEHGPFRGPADLEAVKGVGPRTLERLAPWLEWGSGDAGRIATRPDLNSVDEAFLVGLAGIGPQLAQQVLRVRRRRGGFHSWAEVRAVPGIGASRLGVLQNATRLDERPSPKRLEPPERGRP